MMFLIIFLLLCLLNKASINGQRATLAQISPTNLGRFDHDLIQPLLQTGQVFHFDNSYLPNPTDMTNEGNVKRVLSILNGNIKQWSFIESQLLEPNVNLGMVSCIAKHRFETFIPRHEL